MISRPNDETTKQPGISKSSSLHLGDRRQTKKQGEEGQVVPHPDDQDINDDNHNKDDEGAKSLMTIPKRLNK